MSKNSSWNLYVEGLKINWSFVFSSSDMATFIKLSKDDSPLHTNSTLTKKLNFKSPLLHGALLTTQLSRLIGKELPDNNAMTVGFTIDFVNPAYTDEELFFYATLLYKSESTKLVNFEFKMLRSKTIIAQGKITAKWLDFE